MVTLTTMLVVATITSTIQSDLPKTSYYKLIDWWLFFSANVLVVTMIFHTFLAYLTRKAKEKDDNLKQNGLQNKTMYGTLRYILSSIYFFYI